MLVNRIKVSYDKDADVLYLAFGKNQKALSVEVSENEILRVDPKTREIVGVTLLDASKHEAVLPIIGKFTPSKILEKRLAKAS